MYPFWKTWKLTLIFLNEWIYEKLSNQVFIEWPSAIQSRVTSSLLNIFWVLQIVKKVKLQIIAIYRCDSISRFEVWAGGWQISLSLIIFILSAFILLYLNTELMYVILSCWSGNTASKAFDLFKFFFFEWKNYLGEVIFFFFSWDTFSDSHDSAAE